MSDLSNARELLLMPYTNDMAADADFSADLEELWQIIKPLYQKLHGYVR